MKLSYNFIYRCPKVRYPLVQLYISVSKNSSLIFSPTRNFAFSTSHFVFPVNPDLCRIESWNQISVTKL